MSIARLLRNDDVVVARATWRAARGRAEPQVAHRRIKALLADPRRPSANAAPSSLLCVRNLSLRVMAADSSGRTKARAGNPDLNATIDLLAHHAVRPALAQVPTGAKAVLFADRAELLACLALDLLAGAAASRWWWRALFGTQDLADAMQEACLHTPQFVPSMLDKLARKGAASRLVRSFSPHALDQILAAVEACHGLTSASTAEARADIETARSPGQAVGVDPVRTATRREGEWASPSAFDAPRHLRPTPAPAVVARHVPEALAAGLLPPQRALLTIGLGLVRAASELRGTAAAWRHWLQAEALDRRVKAAGIRDAPVESREAIAGAPGHRPGRRTAVAPDPATARRPSRLAPAIREAQGKADDAGPRAVDPGADALSTTPRHVAGTAPRDPAKSSAGHAMASIDLADANGRDPSLACTQAPGRSAWTATAATAQAADAANAGVVATEFGGLFFLVNLAISLGLYGDFTRPSKPGIALSPWDFLALAGERFVGPQLRGDPLWALLAALAGRADEVLPGAHFTPPVEWRMPPSWLRPFTASGGRWRWCAGPSRLQVLHPAGFFVAALARAACEPRTQLRMALRPYRDACRFRLQASPVPIATEPVGPLERWCSWIMPCLGSHVALALRRRSPDEALALLLRQPARVVLGAARMDIHLPIDRLPIEVRLAGLDRDPGWIPAGGRTLAFHYD